MKWYRNPDRLSLIFTVVVLATHCSMGWRAFSSFHIDDSIWPFISVGSIYNRFETIILSCSMFLGLFITIKNIKKLGLEKKWVLNFIGIIMVGVVVIVGHAVVVRMLTQMLNSSIFITQNLPKLDKYVQDTDNNLKYRSEFSKIIASEKFISTGEITNYIDQKGIPKNYVPTVQARTIRNGKLSLESKIIPSFKRYMIVWLGVLIVPIITCLFWPVNRHTA